MDPIFTITRTILEGIRRDMRVRWGVGAGASVLLSAGVLGLGGTIVPGFLHASSTSQTSETVQEIVPTAPAPILFPAQEDEGFMIDRSQETVAEVLGSLSKASRFNLLAYNAGVASALSGAGTVTVFVPMSSKFDYFPRGYIAGLTKPELRQLVVSHIVERALPLEESLSGSLITLGGTALSFKVDASAEAATVGGAKVVAVYKAKNGYVYIIDKVLVGAN